MLFFIYTGLESITSFNKSTKLCNERQSSAACGPQTVVRCIRSGTITPHIRWSVGLRSALFGTISRPRNRSSWATRSLQDNCRSTRLIDSTFDPSLDSTLLKVDWLDFKDVRSIDSTFHWPVDSTRLHRQTIDSIDRFRGLSISPEEWTSSFHTAVTYVHSMLTLSLSHRKKLSHGI